MKVKIKSIFLKIKYFLKSYKYDLITAVSAIVLLLISGVVPYFKENQAVSNVLRAVIILFSAFVVIYLRSKDKDFYFISLTKRESKDDWMGKGSFEYDRTQNCFSITDSESGYIYSKCLIWSDYKLSFDFKIIKDCMGVIVRAVNLSNYAMLQVQQNGIKPHIRVNSGWSWLEPKDANLLFTNSLSLDKWYKCIFSCDKGAIDIKLLDKECSIFERQWGIPKGKVIFEFKKDDNDKEPTRIPFPINLEYGSVGFRNWGNEKALVKNVLIQKI